MKVVENSFNNLDQKLNETQDELILAKNELQEMKRNQLGNKIRRFGGRVLSVTQTGTKKGVTAVGTVTKNAGTGVKKRVKRVASSAGAGVSRTFKGVGSWLSNAKKKIRGE